MPSITVVKTTPLALLQALTKLLLNVLAPAFFGVTGRTMPHRVRLFHCDAGDNHRRLTHFHAGWRDRTGAEAPEDAHEEYDLNVHMDRLLQILLSNTPVCLCVKKSIDGVYISSHTYR